MSSLLDAAARYAHFGWPVFPCRPRAKVPQTPNGLKDATTDQRTIEDWWTATPYANVAVVTGHSSGLVVLDVDGDEGAASLRALERQHGQIPCTLSTVTPRGGQHFFFQYPGHEVRNSASKLGIGLDVRGDGGYVLAPPSAVSGRAYEVDERRAPAPMPAWLREAAVPLERQIPPSEWLSIVRDGVRGPDIWAGGPSEGRNDKLARLVGHLLRRYVDVDLVLEIVHLVNEHRFQPPLAGSEVDRIVASIARKELCRQSQTDRGARS
jgi:hypothetical protein